MIRLFVMKISRNMTNSEVSDLLRAVAAAYEVKAGKNWRFKSIAYSNAAASIEHLSSEVKDLFDEGKLDDIPGVGKNITKHLSDVFKNGKSTHFEKVFEGLPPAMFELLRVGNIGPKRAYVLSKKLNISSKNPITDLKKKAKAGFIAKLSGFGADSQNQILEGISSYEKRGEKRMLLSEATRIADDVISWMNRCGDCVQIEALGSLRRKASTVGDIDIAVASDNAEKVIEHFVSYPEKRRLIEKGEKTASIVTKLGVQVDLMVQEPTSFGSLLQHFTGSKHHNIALREYALKKGLSLSEYGIKTIGKDSKSKVREFSNEDDFYNTLGMEWIPPELREDSGEIKAALNKSLPKLVEIADIKADLQIHSDFDIETSHDVGSSSMEEIIKKANELGYEYIAFTEHNPSQRGHSESQIVEILKRKREKIEKINYSLKKGVKRVFNSLEVDILPGGGIALSERALELLDFALVSIHSSFNQDKKRMTKRVLSALYYPKTKIFAHPTARKINYREGIEIDWDSIFDYCVKNNKWIEINAEPSRLDLPDFLVREAKAYGVKFSLGTDSHNAESMNNMKYGVFVARRGWTTKHDIINTRSLKEFEFLISNY